MTKHRITFISQTFLFCLFSFFFWKKKMQLYVVHYVWDSLFLDDLHLCEATHLKCFFFLILISVVRLSALNTQQLFHHCFLLLRPPARHRLHCHSLVGYRRSVRPWFCGQEKLKTNELSSAISVSGKKYSKQKTPPHILQNLEYNFG